MNKLILSIIVGMSVCIGCAGCGPGDIEPHITIKDDIKMCGPVCLREQDLGCPEGNDLIYPEECIVDAANTCEYGLCINGFCTETCVMVCEGLVQQGIQSGLECRLNITSCEEIESVCR